MPDVNSADALIDEQHDGDNDQDEAENEEDQGEEESEESIYFDSDDSDEIRERWPADWT